MDDVAKRLSKTPKIGIPSPKAELGFALGHDTISLSYSRSFKLGRKIFGGIVPYDSIWRAGAKDPTKINLPVDIQFGKQTIPRGKYSLYTIPGLHKWLLIFNTDLTQLPTKPDRAKDFEMIPLLVRNAAKKTDQFTKSPKWCTLICRNGALLFAEMVHSQLPNLVHCYSPITNGVRSYKSEFKILFFLPLQP